MGAISFANVTGRLESAPKTATAQNIGMIRSNGALVMTAPSLNAVYVLVTPMSTAVKLMSKP
jgi:hypothetical protein